MRFCSPWSSQVSSICSALNFYQFAAEKDRVIVAMFSWLLLVVRTDIMLRIGAPSGGVDVISTAVKKKARALPVEKTVAAICCVIIACSNFVYHGLTCILLSVVQIFDLGKAAGVVLKGSGNAVEFEIVAKNPEELRGGIIYNLKHGAAIVRGKGCTRKGIRRSSWVSSIHVRPPNS